MVNSKLLSYIQTNQAKGYTIQQLREYLIRQGYNPAEVDEAAKYAGRGIISSPMQPTALQQTPAGKLGFFKKIVLIIKSPKEFFNHVKTEPGIKKALIFLILITILTYILNVPVKMILSFLKNPDLGVVALIGSLVSLVIIPLAVIIFIPVFLILAGLDHLLVKIVGGKKPFDATFRVAVYGALPGMILTVLAGIPYVVPYATIIITLWGTALFIIGLSILQEISYVKAFIVAIIPFIIIFAIVALISAALLGSPFAFLTGSKAAAATGTTFPAVP